MKKFRFLVALLVTFCSISLNSFTQSTVLLRGDTIKIYKVGDTAVAKVDSLLFVTGQTIIGRNYSSLLSSASLDLRDSTRAIILNRMWDTSNVVTPINGMLIYQESNNKFYRREAGVWEELGSGGSSYTFTNGLTESAGTVKLGGNLIENTTIDGQSIYDLNLLNYKNYFSIVDDNLGHTWNDYMFTGANIRAAKTFNNTTQYEMGFVYVAPSSSSDSTMETFWYSSTTIPNFTYGGVNHGKTNLRLRPGNFLITLRGNDKDWQATNVNQAADTTNWKPLAWNSSDSSIKFLPYWAGGGGGTPTLQQVTDVNDTTTHVIIAEGIGHPDGKFTLLSVGGIGKLQLANAGDFGTTLLPMASSTGGTLYMRTPNGTDSIATLADVRAGGGGGYTTLAQFTSESNWTTGYINGSGDYTALSIGASGTSLTSNGASSAPSWVAKENAFTETATEFTGSTSMSITLSNTPISGKAEMYYLNGVLIKQTNVSRTGTSVTLSGFTRESSDIITAKFSY